MLTIREALLRARRRPRHLGAGSPTIYRGDGYEFVELRAYIPGDDVRRIDWAATARAGDLQTRVVLEDVALTLAAIVDTSPSMRVGRRRPLLDAAREALRAWFAAARPAGVVVRISRPITPVVMAYACVKWNTQGLPLGCMDSARIRPLNLVSSAGFRMTMRVL